MLQESFGDTLSFFCSCDIFITFYTFTSLTLIYTKIFNDDDDDDAYLSPIPKYSVMLTTTINKILRKLPFITTMNRLMTSILLTFAAQQLKGKKMPYTCLPKIRRNGTG